MQTGISYQKICWVPMCCNTALLTPDKAFFYIPMGDIRKKWSLAMGRPLPPKAYRFICEDHFDLKKDTKNYYNWKVHKEIKLKLKKGILPHKNGCHLVENIDATNNVKTAEASTNTHSMEKLNEVGSNKYHLEDSTRLWTISDHFNVKVNEKLHNNELETYVFMECKTSSRGFKVLKVV